jgi:hypothetical protein
MMAILSARGMEACHWEIFHNISYANHGTGLVRCAFDGRAIPNSSTA